MKDKAFCIPIPRKFSFIEEPDDALSVIASLFGAHKETGFDHVWLDHSNCELLDLGASVVMDVISMELKKSWKLRKPAVHFAGKYPGNVRVQEILRTSGIIHHLKAEDQSLYDFPHVKRLSLIPGRKEVKPYRSSPQEIAQQKFAEYVNECLLTQQHMLTENGRGDICRMVGEILTNAEEHSGLDKWYIIGYLTQEGSGIDRCNLAI